jgi:hypothetical protein
VIRGTRESVGALPSREAWSRAVRYMELSEPSQARRQGLKPQDTWQRRSPPEQGGRVQSRGTRDSVEALPSREAGSEAAGHMAVRLTPCLGLEACMRGYSIYRVSTVAHGPTSGEVANPQVGPTYLFSKSGNDYHLVAGRQHCPPRRWCQRSGSAHQQQNKCRRRTLGRRCRRSESAHHQRIKRRWRAP